MIFRRAGNRIKVTENGAQFLDNFPARGIHKRPYPFVVKYPVIKAEKLSDATRDIAITIHVHVLIKDVLHLLCEVFPCGIAAFDHLVEKNPEERFQVIRDLMGSSQRIT